MKHHNNFDLLRLFAAFQVMYTHSIGHLHLPGRPGVIFNIIYSMPGVAIFFVISGFLVTDSYLRSPTIGTFFGKRALRIYPGLIVNLIVIEGIIFWMGGNKGALDWPLVQFYLVYAFTAASDWATFLTGLYPWNPGWGWFGAYPSQVLWTLTVELSFYAALPLALLPRSRWMRTVFVAALAFGSYRIGKNFNPVTAVEHPFISSSTLPYFWIFALGVLARLNWESIARLFQGTALFWAAAYAVATFLLPDPQEGTLLNFIFPNSAVALRMIILAGLIFSAAFTMPTAANVLQGQDISYGLYLYHMLVLQSLTAWGLKGEWWLWPIVIVGSVALASLSWFVVERPAKRFKPRSRSDGSEVFPSTWTSAPAAVKL